MKQLILHLIKLKTMLIFNVEQEKINCSYKSIEKNSKEPFTSGLILLLA